MEALYSWLIANYSYKKPVGSSGGSGIGTAGHASKKTELMY